MVSSASINSSDPAWSMVIEIFASGVWMVRHSSPSLSKKVSSWPDRVTICLVLFSPSSFVSLGLRLPW